MTSAYKLSIEGTVCLKHLLVDLYDIGQVAYFWKRVSKAERSYSPDEVRNRPSSIDRTAA